jgi:hypothetical protein
VRRGRPRRAARRRLGHAEARFPPRHRARRGVGCEQSGAGQAAQRRGRVGRGFAGQGQQPAGDEFRAQRLGDRVEVRRDVQQRRVGGRQIREDLIGHPGRGRGAGVGEGGEQVVGPGVRPGQRLAGEVHQGRPAGGQGGDLVGQFRVGQAVFLAQHPGDLAGRDGQEGRAALGHRAGQQGADGRGRRAARRDPDAGAVGQSGQAADQRPLVGRRQRVEVVHQDRPVARPVEVTGQPVGRGAAGSGRLARQPVQRRGLPVPGGGNIEDEARRGLVVRH